MKYEELFALLARPGEKLDDEWIETAEEIIRQEGEVVGRQDWNSGGPGAGAGSIKVYRFRGVFISDDDAGNYGPYQSFAEAADAAGLLTVTDATEKIWIDEEYRKVKAAAAPKQQTVRARPAPSKSGTKPVMRTPDPDGEETPEEAQRLRERQVARQRRGRRPYGH
jgi:hypothetical protein